MRSVILPLLALLLGLGVCRAATSVAVVSPRVTVSLVSATDAAKNGAIELGLRFQLKPGWHIYWSDPGDAGEPPDIALTAPSGAKAGPFVYPAPHLLIAGTVGDYVETGDVLLPFHATLPAGATRIAAKAEWLVCNPQICVPEHGAFTLALPGGAGRSAEAKLFARAAAAMPRPSPYRATIAPDGVLAIAGAGLGRQSVKTARFFPYDSQAIVNAAPQKLGFFDHGFTLRLHLARKTASLAGVVTITDPAGQAQALTMTAVPGAAPVAVGGMPWIVWIGAALLAGVILNLMPCVFPVLAIKALAIARLGHDDRAGARRDALAYAAGAVAAMMVLGGVLIGLRAGGDALGWGFQFQSPVFIAVMAWLTFAIGLNFAGLFSIGGAENLGAGVAGRGGLVGSFATGLLAVVVATPCTAPFMGGALAAALAAPLVIALGIFGALGVGIALPFLLVGLIPSAGRLLPRPGAWMEVLRQALAFPMFATAVWLLWVMAIEAGAAGVLVLGTGAVLIGFALWLLRFRGIAARVVSAAAMLAAALLLVQVAPASAKGAAGSAALAGSVPYSAAKLEALRVKGRPVFVDITAAWCITCQVNERVALAPRAMRQYFATRHVVLMVGDWTRRAPAITRYLAAHGRDGVPLYMYYPPHGAPRMLPQILTPSIVRAALR
ncbi:MAG: protein-disulfide reductase DsbD family protein [Acidiphilium sp.]